MKWQALALIFVCGVLGAVIVGLISGALNFGGTWLVGLGAGIGIVIGLYIAQKRYPQS